MAGSPKRTRLSAVGKTEQRASKRARAVKPREPMLFGCPADVVESSARMTSRTWRLANGQVDALVVVETVDGARDAYWSLRVGDVGRAYGPALGERLRTARAAIQNLEAFIDAIGGLRAGRGVH